MAVQRCKFCGCTERRPCRFAAVTFPFALGKAMSSVLPTVAFGALGYAIVPADASTQLISCGWLLDDVCSNPACVEKAYAEARPFAETIHLALELGLIEEAA
jgi:hypothetical protein